MLYEVITLPAGVGEEERRRTVPGARAAPLEARLERREALEAVGRERCRGQGRAGARSVLRGPASRPGLCASDRSSYNFV